MEQTVTASGRVEARGGRSLLGLVGWLALCFAVAGFGSQFMPGPWFAQLEKPAWNPPGWVFGPVWTLLYAMMAVAAWRVWGRGGWTANRTALALFLAQLLFNGIWSWIFFGLRNPGLAFADIIILWVTLLATVVAFRRVAPVAGWLMAPYLGWVTFASALNFTIWRLNV